MGITMQYYDTDRRYARATPSGLETVYYDPKTGQFVRPNPAATKAGALKYGTGGGKWASEPQFIPVGGQLFGQTTYTPPSVDFNALPRQTPAGVQIFGAGQAAQPYQRPTAPPQNTGSGYRPQFDPSFIQQMLAQRFGNNQGAGIPSVTRPVGPPTLTPGAAQNFGGYQGQGGLGALRALANPAPAGGQGETI